ncbi:hypothetical protein HYFRA_00011008 [Hymenoscyphus fraxineus]|uniref:Uncharacterized protein n=1 Tax=Hymenoscyphus fraxineus TaxID=746836 RepID=A0A9N9L196_9HELO|nr:hypothetical protein HYFRA_00011008 [Hymenoscyphus fraxineus]
MESVLKPIPTDHPTRPHGFNIGMKGRVAEWLEAIEKLPPNAIIYFIFRLFEPCPKSMEPDDGLRHFASGVVCAITLTIPSYETIQSQPLWKI